MKPIQFMLYSIDLKDRVEFKVNDSECPPTTWARYIYGVVQAMKKLNLEIKGFNAAFYRDVPLDTDISSCAAIESYLAFTVNDLSGNNNISKWDLVLVEQAIEQNILVLIEASWTNLPVYSGRKEN